MLQKNDRLTVTIQDYTKEGFGVAKTDGFVLFVSGGVAGDRAEVHVLKVLKTHGYAKIVRLFAPSPARREAACAVSGKCGGCAFHNMSYEEEKRLKAERVRQALSRIGGLSDPPLGEIVGADCLSGYRNKAQYPIRLVNGKPAAGFFAPNSHRLIRSEDCFIQPPIFGRIVRFTLAFLEQNHIPPYDEQTHTGLVRHLYLRHGKATGEILVCVVINGDDFPRDYADALQAAFPAVKCICFNVNTARTNAVLGRQTVFLTPRTRIYDKLLGQAFALSPASFYQVNHDQTERLYALVKQLAAVTANDRVLDLYCGIGSIGICAAADAGRLVGVEIVPEAVENAAENARRNGLTNAEYLCADAAEGARLFSERGERFDTIIIDPPRKGCDEATLRAIETLAPQKLIYVSCDPATLARDIARLAGYTLQSALPIDLFPRTAHVETVAKLCRKPDPAV